MTFTQRSLWALMLATAAFLSMSSGPAAWGQSAAAGSSTARPVGTIKAMSGNTVTLTTDAGAELNIVVLPETRIVRAMPGQKDLRDAAPLQLQQLEPGDRMLVRGRVADDKSVVASSIVVMKRGDIAQQHEQEQQDWQKRGIGGMVSAVDAAAGTVTISAGVAKKTLLVHATKDTSVRRYSPDSVKFDDAKPAALDQIKPGDQLRARGDRSPDGNELRAEEIVFGTFRNVAGTVIAADAGSNTLRVLDLATKKPVTLKISSDSQLKKLPPFMAQRLAMRLKGEATGGAAPPGEAAAPAGVRGPATEGRPAGTPDFQQILSRLPSANLTDLQKGDAIIMVATEGSANSEPTVITLLLGVEPILTASPAGGNAAMLLSPWSLGSSAADALPQ